MELHSLGKYRLVAPLRRGPGRGHPTTCQFYSARHEDEPAEQPPSYVVKLLMPSRSEEAVRRRARFQHEARLLQACNHASIPTVHAAGDQDGVPYIVMDRVDGIDLATLLRHDTGESVLLSKEVAVYVVGQLADALHHIHSIETMEDSGPEPLNVVHRDLNPSHVLLSSVGDALLCGFGAASSRWLPSTYDDPMAGYLAYMAPERLAARTADVQRVQSDLFSLAVVLWEMLKGQRCFAAETANQIRDNITHFDIAQSGRRVFGLSPKLGDVLRKNMDRDPSRRYTDAYQMLQRLAQSPEAQAAEAARAELGSLVRGSLEARPESVPVYSSNALHASSPDSL